MKSALAIKQCEVNCLALFDHYKLPHPYTIATLPDRTMFFATDAFWDAFAPLVPKPKDSTPGDEDRRTVDPALPFETWDFVRGHGTSARRGWRERVAMWSMQLILHEQSLLEADFDMFNPNFGAAPAMGHLAEVLSHSLRGSKTDPFRVLKGLRKRGINVTDVREKEIST